MTRQSDSRVRTVLLSFLTLNRVAVVLTLDRVVPTLVRVVIVVLVLVMPRVVFHGRI